jgi:hypothetical protein
MVEGAALEPAPDPPPVIGRATPNDGRPGVRPGFLPNALTTLPLQFDRGMTSHLATAKW